jgi:hypothetical protein
LVPMRVIFEYNYYNVQHQSIRYDNASEKIKIF